MMDTRKIKAALATLPYREMRELGKELAGSLDDPGRHEDFANAMSGLIDAPASKEADAEQDILGSCFTRKRIFTIQPYKGGFKIAVNSLDSAVYTDNIRAGISEMLDQIVAIKVLE